MEITLPVFIDFKRWTEAIKKDLPQYNITVYDGSITWQEWADSIIKDNAFDSSCPIPDKLLYPEEEDWQEWAVFFIRFLSNL